jgi:hypothetical protein
MDALEPFERLARQTGKHLSEPVVSSNEMALGFFQRKYQFGRQRS